MPLAPITAIVLLMLQDTSLLLSIVLSTLFVAIVLSLLLYFGVEHEVLRLLEWLQAQSGWAPLLFILIMALVVVLLLPGVLFTVGAGFVFGVVAGSVYVVVGTTLGATVAFVIARYLFGNRAARAVRSHPKLQALNQGFLAQGGRIVLLTRLVPFFPAKLANYFFGLTRCRLSAFVGGTFFGIIPYSVHNVYLGAIAADLTALSAGELNRTPLQWVIYSVGFVIAVVAVIYLSRWTRRALSQQIGPVGPVSDNRL